MSSRPNCITTLLRTMAGSEQSRRVVTDIREHKVLAVLQEIPHWNCGDQASVSLLQQILSVLMSACVRHGGVSSGGSVDMLEEVRSVAILSMELGIWIKTDTPVTAFEPTDASIAAYHSALRKQRGQKRNALPLSALSMSVVQNNYPALVGQTENIWVYLAHKVLNISHFCMSDVHDSATLVSTSLMAIPTPVPVLRHFFRVLHKDPLVENSDIQSAFSVYEYCKFCADTDRKWRNMINIITYNIAPADVCYHMTCDPNFVCKCQQLTLNQNEKRTDFEWRLCVLPASVCIDVSNNMWCNFTVLTASHLNHVKLPTGWLFSCGNYT
ncbi:uncharacterized protein [Ambystoma mexicanum]|uniref:uncharacterized protein n=1 Tax=Ambystoma mexicanum TaxID=8296 RepID=UPI0037E820D0